MEEGADADDRTVMTISKEEIKMSMRLISALGKKSVFFNRTELDSHADTCVCGKNCVMLEDSGVTVNVSPFTNEYASIKNVPIGTCATSLELENGEVLVLIIHQALFFGDRLPFTLLNPNQLRDNGITVEDVPRQFNENSRHSIIVPPAGGEELVIPLQLNGVISFINTRRPTQKELEENVYVELTSPDDWEPYSAHYEKREHQAIEESRNRDIWSIQRISEDDVLSETEIDDWFQDSETRFNQRNAVQYRITEECRDRMVNAISTWQGVTEFDDVDVDLEISKAALITDDECSVGSTEDTLNDERKISTVSLNEKRSTLTKEELANRWGIGLEAADRTLRVTTQKGIRKVLHPVERRYRTRQNQLRFPTLGTKFYSDTMFSSEPSCRNFTCAQVFSDGKGFTRFYPMERKREAGEKLYRFVTDVGIPQELITDGAKEETESRWKDVCKEFRIISRTTEPYSPWQNRAEAEIREMKKGMLRIQRKTGSPKRLWCYLGEWYQHVRSLTAGDNPVLNGRSPTERVRGNTPDISEYAQFDWYEYCWLWDSTESFPKNRKRLVRFIGVAETVGSPMCLWVLTDTGKVMARSSVTKLTSDDKLDPEVRRQMEDLDAKIEAKIGNSRKGKLTDAETAKLFPDQSDAESGGDEDPIESDNEIDQDYTPVHADEYLSVEVMLPYGGQLKRAKVKNRKRDEDGKPVGLRNQNPILDSREYEVEFPDGSVDFVTANIIAENLYSQVDAEGNSVMYMKEILDHKKDGTALSKDDGYFTTNAGKRVPKRSTKGWKFLVSWKDESSTWVTLKDLKESNPVQVAEYVVANKLSEEPAFNWWVNHVLKKRDRIIKKVRARYWKKAQKYGIELPHSVKEALEIDARTGTTFWRDAIEKEMKNVDVAFKFVDGDVIPVGFKEIACHMIFDVKMDLTRKARFVAGGHMTEPPKDSTYSSVVARDSVRIMFLVAALNGLDVLSADVQNAYLNAKTQEKVYFIAGEEFGPNKGRPALIVRALYGLKSSGARWRDHMARSLRSLQFVSCKADPDVWMRPAVRSNGEKYYEYVLVYVDDILVVSEKPKVVMDRLSEMYTLKDGSVKEPETYLGAQFSKFLLPNGEEPEKPRWAMSSDIYVKRAVKDVEAKLEGKMTFLPKKASTPMVPGYRPELDSSRLLNDEEITQYQGHIGVLRWICELGRIDILVAVSMLSRYSAAPREGHLHQVIHVFAYLKKYERSRLVFDDNRPDLKDAKFVNVDWKETYPEAEDQIPPNMPEPRGKSVVTTCWVDADHAGCQETRRSHTGIIIYVNSAPILWFSKRQNTVETSTFGSEFVAMKQAVDLVEGLRYKLRMMGIPLDGATSVLCDNLAVVTNSSVPSSPLKKRHNAIAYHRTREASAAGIINIAKIDGEVNLADILTKLMPGPKLREMIGKILY